MRSMLALLVLPAAALAQTAPPMEFPEGSELFTPQALQERFAGKVFSGNPADGTTWRLEYKQNGYAYFNNSNGVSDTGKWRVEGSSLCTEWRRLPSGCSEPRHKGDVIYVKRASNGEIVPLTLK